MTIVQSAARLFECRAGIVILEGESVDLKAVGQVKISERDREARLTEMRKFYPMPFDPERNYVSRAIATRTTVLLDDTEAPEVAEFVRELGRIGGYRSFVQVPLIREGAGIGAIALTFEQPNVRLNDNQRALIQSERSVSWGTTRWTALHCVNVRLHYMQHLRHHSFVACC